jgi:hypothetical protein
VHDLQKSQLRHDEEQEEDTRSVGVQEVLQALPVAHRSQGKQVALFAEARRNDGAVPSVLFSNDSG